jgi:NTE family protein
VEDDALKSLDSRPWRAGFEAVRDDPWLVLGGGGVKGLAHVGALRAIHEAGYRPKGILGTSIGALVGVLAGSGMDDGQAERLAKALEREDIVRFNRRAVWINGVRQMSVLRGDTLRDYLERVLPAAGWPAITLPVAINAVDLADGGTEWFGVGVPGARDDVSLVDAVYASCALPGFYPPLEIDGRTFVDGGAQHPLPVHKAAEVGAGRVIAVDVGAGRAADVEAVMSQGLLGIHQRVFSMMSYRVRQDALRGWSGPPMVYVRPNLDGYGPFGFEHIGYFLEEGYRAAKQALADVA